MSDTTRPKIRPDRLHEYDSWRALGLSEAGAVDALRSRDPLDAVLVSDGYDRQVSAFRALGLSETQAEQAAIGRAGSEGHARTLAEAHAPGAGTAPPAAKPPVPDPGSPVQLAEANVRAAFEAVTGKGARRPGSVTDLTS